jgi:hypothetical protein
MAALTSAKGVNRTKSDSKPIEFLEASNNYGKLRKLIEQYVLADADTLESDAEVLMMKIPEGAKLVGAKVTTSGALGSATIDIGWKAGAKGLEAGSADGIIDGLDVSSAVNQGGVLATEGGFMKEFLEEVDVFLTAKAQLAGTGAQTITVELDIVVE